MTLTELADWLARSPRSSIGFRHEKDDSWTAEVIVVRDRGKTSVITRKNGKTPAAAARSATCEAMGAQRPEPGRKLASCETFRRRAPLPFPPSDSPWPPWLPWLPFLPRSASETPTFPSKKTMSAPHKSIVDWVTKRRTSMSEDQELVSRFELWHAVDGEVSEPLGRYDMETRDDDEDPEDLVQEIWNDAHHDAGTRPQGSYQRYVIKAFRGEGSSEMPDETRGFAVTGSAVSSAMGGTESPTPRGMMAQEMRQNDNLHGMVIRLADASAGQLAAQLRESREENANLMAQRSRLLDIEQRLLDRSHEREMDKLERSKSGERMDMVLGMLTTFGPMILSKLFEGKGLPAPIAALMGAGGGGGQPGQPGGSGSGDQGPGSRVQGPGSSPPADVEAANRVRRAMSRDAGVGNLLGTLDSQQVQGLASILRPDQAMGFMQLYQDFRSEHAAQETKGNDHGNEETH